MKPKRTHSAMNDLWSYFIRVVEIIKPEVFLTENVPEFIRSREFETYKQRAQSLGYHLEIGVLNAFEYGVPQKRKRAFCFGSRLGQPHLPLPIQKRTNVRDAIGHLPLEPNGVNWHIGRMPTEKSKERYKVIPPGGNRFDLMKDRPDLTPPCWIRKKTGTTDVFGRMRWGQPSTVP